MGFWNRLKWFEKKKEDGSLQLPFEAKLEGEEQELGIDIYSPTWRFIEKWATETLAQKRLSNDNINLSGEKTAALRGEIRIIKRLIDLPNSAGESHHGIINRQFELPEGEEENV